MRFQRELLSSFSPFVSLKGIHVRPVCTKGAGTLLASGNVFNLVSSFLAPSNFWGNVTRFVNESLEINGFEVPLYFLWLRTQPRVKVDVRRLSQEAALPPSEGTPCRLADNFLPRGRQRRFLPFSFPSSRLWKLSPMVTHRSAECLLFSPPGCPRASHPPEVPVQAFCAVSCPPRLPRL